MSHVTAILGKRLSANHNLSRRRNHFGVGNDSPLVTARFPSQSLLLVSTIKQTSSSHFWPETERLNDGQGFIFGTEFGEGVGMRGLLGAVQRT